MAIFISWMRIGSGFIAGIPRRGNFPPSAITPLEPVNLAVDQAGNLMVVSYAGDGVVYALMPAAKSHAAEA